MWYILNYNIKKGSHISLGWFSCGSLAILVELEFGDVSFGRREKLENQQKNPWSKATTNNKLTIKPGPHIKYQFSGVHLITRFRVPLWNQGVVQALHYLLSWLWTRESGWSYGGAVLIFLGKPLLAYCFPHQEKVPFCWMQITDDIFIAGYFDLIYIYYPCKP